MPRLIQTKIMHYIPINKQQVNDQSSVYRTLLRRRPDGSGVLGGGGGC
jgi:hypothetical protein